MKRGLIYKFNLFLFSAMLKSQKDDIENEAFELSLELMT